MLFRSFTLLALLFTQTTAWSIEFHKHCLSQLLTHDTLKTFEFQNSLTSGGDYIDQVLSYDGRVELYFKQSLGKDWFIQSVSDNYVILEPVDTPDMKEATIINVVQTQVSNEYRQQGLNYILYAEALKHFPKAKTVRGMLVQVNQQAFISEFERTNNSLLATKNTPFYKTLSRFGFTEISFETEIHPGVESVLDQYSKRVKYIIEVNLTRP